eukprot:Selendium_serpulae@DN6484_c3_g1_i1.p1
MQNCKVTQSWYRSFPGSIKICSSGPGWGNVIEVLDKFSHPFSGENILVLFLFLLFSLRGPRGGKRDDEGVVKDDVVVCRESEGWRSVGGYRAKSLGLVSIDGQ